MRALPSPCNRADIGAIRNAPPLPETADELCEIGRRLGVPESEILLGARATERALKALSEQGRLAEYGVLHFATHGALAGEVKGSAEPGLVLTPPAQDTGGTEEPERDDGFLTASEISTLKLDADWVVLSACNTAGSSGTSEALSGLARAFFYAGARALLVSHWAVESDVAVRLTTRAFEVRPAAGRAEALRIAMRDLAERGKRGGGASVAMGTVRCGRRRRCAHPGSLGRDKTASTATAVLRRGGQVAEVEVAARAQLAPPFLRRAPRQREGRRSALVCNGRFAVAREGQVRRVRPSSP